MNDSRHNERVFEFWRLIHAAADYAMRAAADDAYYAKGFCGRCSDCGNPPFDTRVSELFEIIEDFRELFSESWEDWKEL